MLPTVKMRDNTHKLPFKSSATASQSFTLSDVRDLVLRKKLNKSGGSESSGGSSFVMLTSENLQNRKDPTPHGISGPEELPTTHGEGFRPDEQFPYEASGSQQTVSSAVYTESDVGADHISLTSSHVATYFLQQPLQSELAKTTYTDDHFAAKSFAPRVPQRLQHMYYKILVVGESGLGKTTFIQNLFEPYMQGQPYRSHDGTGTSLEMFSSDPSQLRTVLPKIPLVEASRELQISIQDTPGYGDDVNLARYLRLIVSHILEERAKDFQEFEGNTRVCMDGTLPNSVSICLYFLPPHRVKKVDIILMSALSQVVALVPIISKADSMTADELKAYRQEIRDILKNPGKYVEVKASNTPDSPAAPSTSLQISTWNFDHEDFEALGMDNGSSTVPPFAVVSSTQVNRHRDEYMPYRDYGWGICNSMDRAHSDSIIIKRLLMGDKVNSIWGILEDSTQRYKTFCVKYKASGCNLSQLVKDVCWVCEEQLEVDEIVSKKQQVRELQQQLAAALKETSELADSVQQHLAHIQSQDAELGKATRREQKLIDQVGDLEERLAKVELRWRFVCAAMLICGAVGCAAGLVGLVVAPQGIMEKLKVRLRAVRCWFDPHNCLQDWGIG